MDQCSTIEPYWPGTKALDVEGEGKRVSVRVMQCEKRLNPGHGWLCR